MGGRSPWGSFLDAACERYKWTYDYVMWEISYVNLTMMLSDAISIDYDTDNKTARNSSKSYNNKGIPKKKASSFGDFLSNMKQLKE